MSYNLLSHFLKGVLISIVTERFLRRGKKKSQPESVHSFKSYGESKFVNIKTDKMWSNFNLTFFCFRHNLTTITEYHVSNQCNFEFFDKIYPFYLLSILPRSCKRLFNINAQNKCQQKYIYLTHHRFTSK